MDDREAPDPLKDFEKRLGQASSRKSGTRQSSSSSSNAMAMGLRIGLELVVGVIVGIAVGWVFDRWLGTKPWGLIGGFFLGTAAGMVNVYRAVAGLGMAAGYRQDGGDAQSRPDNAKQSDDWDED